MLYNQLFPGISPPHHQRHLWKLLASSWLAGRVDTLPKSKTRLLPREPDSSLAFPGVLRAPQPCDATTYRPRTVCTIHLLSTLAPTNPRSINCPPRARIPFPPAPPDSPHDLPRRLHVLLPSYPTRSAVRPRRASSGNTRRDSEVPEDPSRAPSYSSAVGGAIEIWRV